MKSYLILVYFAISLFCSLSLTSQTTLTCPADLSLTCQAQIFNLSVYGEAQVTRNGQTYPAGLANVNKNLNNCNIGTIIRTWQIEDENQNLIECSQTLTFEAGLFDVNNITWPQSEVQLKGCGNTATIDSLPPGVGRPTFDYVLCCLLYTSPSPRDATLSRMPSSA